MATDNSVTITGNTGRDPELRFTPSGQPVANFSVAVSRRWQNRQTQEWMEATSWIDVTAWGQLARNVADSISRGCRVTVIGRLDQRSWETGEGGKRSKVEIVADDIATSLKWATATVARNPPSSSTEEDREPVGAGVGANGSHPNEEPF